MKKESGFTLIEFIIMIVVASFVVTGLVFFTRQQVTAAARLDSFQIAFNLARLKIAEANNTSYDDLALGSTDLTDDPSFPEYDLRRVVSSVWTTDWLGETFQVRQVEIMVYGPGGVSTPPLARLRTYRQSHTTFGDGL